MNGYLRMASLAAALLWAAPATAATYNYTYTYVGAPFTSRSGCVGAGCGYVQPNDVGPNVIASIPTFWSTEFPTGTWNISPNGGGFVESGGLHYSAAAGFSTFGGFLTLTNGIVTDWNLFGSFGGHMGFSSSARSTPAGDGAGLNANLPHGLGFVSASGSGPAGTWSGGPLVVTPLPPALLLFGSVLGLAACWAGAGGCAATRGLITRFDHTDA